MEERKCTIYMVMAKKSASLPDGRDWNASILSSYTYRHTFSHRGGIFSRFEGVATRAEAQHAFFCSVLLNVMSYGMVVACMLLWDDSRVYVCSLLSAVLMIFVGWNAVQAPCVRRMHAFGRSYLLHFCMIPAVCAAPFAIIITLGCLPAVLRESGIVLLLCCAVDLFLVAVYQLYWWWRFLFTEAQVDKDGVIRQTDYIRVILSEKGTPLQKFFYWIYSHYGMICFCQFGLSVVLMLGYWFCPYLSAVRELEGRDIGYALNYGAEGEDVGLIRTALRAGADVNEKNEEGNTPLLCVMVRQLSGAPLDVNDLEASVKALVDAGADVNARCGEPSYLKGLTPLHLAIVCTRVPDTFGKDEEVEKVCKKYESIIKMLLKAGASVDMMEPSGVSVLTEELEGNRLNNAKLLIAAGADVKRAEREGARPLHLASYRGDVVLVKQLIEAGADVNIKAGDGSTPLSVSKNDEISQLLIAAGADSCIQGSQKSFPPTPSFISNGPQLEFNPEPPVEELGEIGLGMDSGIDIGLGDGGCMGDGYGFWSELEGTFYDLTRTRKGTPSDLVCDGVDEGKVVGVLNRFLTSWNGSLLTRYYRFPRKLYAPYFYVPVASAKYGPIAHGAGEQMKEGAWVAVYKGRVKAPWSGKFRFVGTGDDCVAVRFDFKPVLEAGYYLPSCGSSASDAVQRFKENRGYETIALEGLNTWNKELGGLTAGAVFEVEEGKVYPIEVMIADFSGDRCGTMLLIEEVTGTEDSGNAAGRYHLFRTNLTFPEDQLIQEQFLKAGCNVSDHLEVPRYNPDSMIWVVVP